MTTEVKTVGTGTPSTRMKARWHKDKSRMSFKQFVRSQVKSGDQDAKDLLANKQGKNDQKPSAAKLERIASGKFGSKKENKK